DGEAGRGWASNLQVARQRRRPQLHPFAERVETGGALFGVRLRGKPLMSEIEMGLGPLRARQRPAGLGALGKTGVDGARPPEHRRLLVPACVLATQKVPEKTLLQAHPVVGVELHPVLQAMNLQPLLVARYPREALEVTSGVQVVRPVRGREHRYRDLLQFRAS